MRRSIFKTVLLGLFLLGGLLENNSFACPGITVSFADSLSASCLPQTLTIRNTSSGTKASTAIYELYVDQVLVDTAHGTSKVFSLQLYRGNHMVTLRSRDTSNCLDSARKTIRITKNVPRFADYRNQFSDAPQWINCIQTANDPDSFRVQTRNEDSLGSLRILWGNGTSDTFSQLPRGSSISRLFAQTGTFPVMLISTDSNGCVDTTYGSVINERIPTAGIIGPNSGFNVGCAPFSIKFTNNSSNISNGTIFTWDFGDGTSVVENSSSYSKDYTHTFGGTLCNGTVRLIASNGCGFSQTTWNPIQVSQKDRALFRVDSSNCDRTGVYQFTNISTDSFCLIPDPKEYLWDFGDGTNSGWLTSKNTVTKTYADEGPKRVCLIARNRCGDDTMCMDLTVVYTPIPGFIHDTLLGCDQAFVRVRDTSIGFGLTRQWTWGDGSSSTARVDSHFYANKGSYNLRLTVSNRCGSRSVTKQVVIKGKPLAGFSGLIDGCAEHRVQLSNTSRSDFNPFEQYAWDFGNGDTSHLKNPPQARYSDSGTYRVRLVVSDTCGSDTAQQTLSVYRVPGIDIQPDTLVCSGDSLWFDLNGSDYEYVLVDYGDGSPTDTFRNKGRYARIYNRNGTFEMRALAVNRGICLRADTAFLRVKPRPQARLFLPDSTACAPFVFRPDNQSTQAGQYQWFLNDTFFSTQEEIDSIVLNTDSVSVQIMLIASESGCKPDTALTRVFTAKNPQAVFVNATDSGCGPLPDTLLNASVYASTFVWKNNGNIFSFQSEPEQNFAPARNRDSMHRLELIARNWLGCADTTFGYRLIYPAPEPEIGADTSNGCGPLLVQISNLTASSGVVSYFWDFGNGQTDTSRQPGIRQYAAISGRDTVYNILLSALSVNGCRRTDSFLIRVHPLPEVRFNHSPDGCGPLQLTFNNQSDPGNNRSLNTMQFEWDFGNGSISSQQNPQSVFPAAASRDTFYRIRLIARTEFFCTDSAFSRIQVYPRPVADFVPDTTSGCSPLSVQFRNFSQPRDTGNIGMMRFEWDFDNGSTDTARNPAMVFLESALIDKNYRVRLIALSEHACRDTMMQNILVHPAPTARIQLSTYAGCGALPVRIGNNSQLNDSSFWDLGQGFSLSPTDTQMTYPFVRQRDTVYDIRLYTRTRFGCFSDTALAQVRVWAQPSAQFNAQKDSICDTDTMRLINTSTAAQNWYWDWGDGMRSNVFEPIHRYARGPDPFASRNFTVQLIAESNRGCRDTAHRTVHIHPYTLADIGNVLDTLCAPLSLRMLNSSTNAAINRWSFNNGDTFFTVEPVFLYRNISNTPRKLQSILRTENVEGCLDADTFDFVVMPEPVADFAPFRRDVCDSGNFVMVNRSQNNLRNEWDFGDGQKSLEIEPSHLLPRSPLYWMNYVVSLKVFNEFGCWDTSSTLITLNPILQADIDTQPVRSLCVGEIHRFENRSRFAVYHHWNFGNGGHSFDSIPEYFYPAPGLYRVVYTAYDLNACADSVVINNMVEVLPRPIADFSFSPTFLKMPASQVTFQNASLPVTGLNYRWNFGDGTALSTQKDPVHTYADSGAYVVQLIADNGFCNDTIEKPLYVEPYLPVPDLLVNDTAGCGPLQVQFQSQSLHTANVRWYFDDGNSSTLQNPVHTFYREGYYNIQLIAFGPGGQVDTTFERLIRVYPKPTAYFSIPDADKYLPRARFYPRNESEDAVRYRWDLFDAFQTLKATSDEEYPAFEINDGGSYGLLLIAENVFGCLDSFERPMSILVRDSGYVHIPNAFSPTKTEGLNDGFRPVMEGVQPEGYLFRIYNRWGEKLFETKDISANWDGTYLGSPCEMEQYVYLVSGLFYDGSPFDRKGTVFLIR